MTSRPDHRSLRTLLAVMAVAGLALASCSSDGDGAAPTTSAGEELAPTGATEIEGLVRGDPLQVGDATLTEVSAENDQHRRRLFSLEADVQAFRRLIGTAPAEVTP